MGGPREGSGRGFPGTIDEVAIYDRALSAEEIGEIYCSGVVPDLNTVGYWSFDEGSGQVAHDWSFNGNDGRLGSSDSNDASDPNWVDADYSPDCPTGDALEFDGVGDYVNCNNTFASVTVSTTKTIMGWARSDVSSAPSGQQRIFTLYRQNDYSAFIILAYGDPGTWQGYCATPGAALLDSGVPVTVNEWVHVALV